mmetsp:Transcript_28936/g.81521  ORF Transcript_28936/g.81521 Transcript_28936/m.81521 type:complete len:304 (-) Transcript_28936:320-1231(-)
MGASMLQKAEQEVDVIAQFRTTGHRFSAHGKVANLLAFCGTSDESHLGFVHDIVICEDGFNFGCPFWMSPQSPHPQQAHAVIFLQSRCYSANVVDGLLRRQLPPAADVDSVKVSAPDDSQQLIEAPFLPLVQDAPLNPTDARVLTNAVDVLVGEQQVVQIMPSDFWRSENGGEMVFVDLRHALEHEFLNDTLRMQQRISQRGPAVTERAQLEGDEPCAFRQGEEEFRVHHSYVPNENLIEHDAAFVHDVRVLQDVAKQPTLSVFRVLFAGIQRQQVHEERQDALDVRSAPGVLVDHHADAKVA